MSAYKIKTTISNIYTLYLFQFNLLRLLLLQFLLLRHSSGIHLKNLLFHHLTIEHCQVVLFCFKSITAFILLFYYILLCILLQEMFKYTCQSLYILLITPFYLIIYLYTYIWWYVKR